MSANPTRARGAFYRLISPGVGPYGRLFLEVEFDGRRLSVSGVEGPKHNGDAKGSFGQCIDALSRLTTLSPEWSPESIAKLLGIWERWHLNSMRPGCEHQRAEGWASRPIDPSKPTNAYGKHFPEQRHDSWNMLTWVARAEHPQGLLSYPCGVCGYKYGSAWLFEQVPDDVLDWLEALPETRHPYPWTRLA